MRGGELNNNFFEAFLIGMNAIGCHTDGHKGLKLYESSLE